ncbi:Os09g0508000, partial [Oryza sativa Japonica Group]
VCTVLRPAGEGRPAAGDEQPVGGVPSGGEAAPPRRHVAGGRRLLLLLLDLLQHPGEHGGVARQLQRPRRRVPERLLGLLQQRPEQRVVHARRPDDEPLPRRADVHREAPLRRPPPRRRPAPVQRLHDQAPPPSLRHCQLLLGHAHAHV